MINTAVLSWNTIELHYWFNNDCVNSDKIHLPYLMKLQNDRRWMRKKYIASWQCSSVGNNVIDASQLYGDSQ